MKGDLPNITFTAATCPVTTRYVSGKRENLPTAVFDAGIGGRYECTPAATNGVVSISTRPTSMKQQ
jgi:hypothetical protein